MSFAAARDRAGLTQYEVAKRIGVDQSAVSLWERGKTAPRAALLPRIAALYRCTIEDLLQPPTQERK